VLAGYGVAVVGFLLTLGLGAGLGHNCLAGHVPSFTAKSPRAPFLGPAPDSSVVFGVSSAVKLIAGADAPPSRTAVDETLPPGPNGLSLMDFR